MAYKCIARYQGIDKTTGKERTKTVRTGTKQSCMEAAQAKVINDRNCAGASVYNAKGKLLIRYWYDHLSYGFNRPGGLQYLEY